MPPRLTAQDYDQELLILFDAYVHGNLDRRGFLDKAQKFAKAGVTAAGLLASLSPNFAMGQQVKPDDGRLKTEWFTLPSPAGSGSLGSRWSVVARVLPCASTSRISDASSRRRSIDSSSCSSTFCSRWMVSQSWSRVRLMMMSRMMSLPLNRFSACS